MLGTKLSSEIRYILRSAVNLAEAAVSLSKSVTGFAGDRFITCLLAILECGRTNWSCRRGPPLAALLPGRDGSSYFALRDARSPSAARDRRGTELLHAPRVT